MSNRVGKTRRLRAFRWGALGALLAGAAAASWAVWTVDRYLAQPLPADFVPLSKVSREMQDATVAMEDGNFYRHGGFDFDAIHRAAVANFERGRVVRGGSTITQQLAKNLFLEPDRTLWRKIREALLASELERRLTKDQILERYLNVVDYGLGHRGVRAAARGYFDKVPADLTLAESAMLVGLVPDPPQRELTRSRAESARKTALLRVAYWFRHRYSSADLETARSDPLEAPHFDRS